MRAVWLLIAACLVVLATPPAFAEPSPHIVRFKTSEGTWLSPTLSPDGTAIVFELLGDLYSVAARGGTARRITAGVSFDSQPSFAPNGRSIVFVSDRSGAENLWIARPDGSQATQITWRTDDCVLTSPVWSADGQSLFVAHVRNDLGGFEMWRVDLASGKITTLLPIEGEQKVSSLSPSPSADGRWLYYAARLDDRVNGELPEWTVRRRNLKTGEDETVVAPPRSYRPDLIIGSMFRPAIARDGRRLIYATRNGAVTWLKIRDLDSGSDRWLTALGDGDELGAVSPWRDLSTPVSLTPDGTAAIVGDRGGLRRIELKTGRSRPINFTADVEMTLPAISRPSVREPSGPVRARIIQAPERSPDGGKLAYSAFGRVYVSDLSGGAGAQPVWWESEPSFQPSWSPDGRSLTYVSWTARAGGQVWVKNGGAAPRRLSGVGAYYTAPVFTPDGRAVIVLRSDRDERNHRYMEYGALRDAELMLLPLDGSVPRLLTRGKMGGKPHFSSRQEVNLLFDSGLAAVPLSGGGPRRHLIQVTGPGFYFERQRAAADDLRLSPDGSKLLVQIAQQLTLIDMTGTVSRSVDLGDPALKPHRVTRIGADYFNWSRDGRSVEWALGSTYFSVPAANANEATAQRYQVEVTLPRPSPTSVIVLRGATAVTMSASGVIRDADIVVSGDRIAAIGPRGSVSLPAGATVRDVPGKWITPGLIDAHDHRADIRRGVLDLDMWSASASLAYGITTLFDPSTLSVDMLAYEDMLDAGLITGARLRSTATALFSFNEFKTKQDVIEVLTRYRDYYHTSNVKLYRSGNRQVRQWVAEAAREMGLIATTEGAGSTKLGLTMVLDGFAGHEHVMPSVPVYNDIATLFAATGTSLTGTLMIANRPSAQDWFIVRDAIAQDAKFTLFTPRFVVDMKLRSRDWFADDAYRFPAYAEGLAKVTRAGGLVAMGSHGEMPGIGYHWELRAHQLGGWSPFEILTAATTASARAIGRDADLGSLEPGKIADLLILDENPIENIENLASLDSVMKAGRLYNAGTLDQLYPSQRPFPRPWFSDDRPANPPQ